MATEMQRHRDAGAISMPPTLAQVGSTLPAQVGRTWFRPLSACRALVQLDALWYKC